MERREHVACHAPVDEVLGVHHRCAGHEVHGGGHEPVVVAHANHVGVGHVGPKHRVLKRVFYLHHLLGISAADDAVAFGGEMERVFGAGTALRRHHMGCGNHLGQAAHHGIVCGAASAHVFAHHLASHERHVGGIEVKVGEEALIHLLHLHGPVLLCGVGLALMEQDAFDDAILLSLLCQFDETRIRVVVVVFGHVFHPSRLLVEILPEMVFVEEVDAASADGDVDDADADAVRRAADHGATEVVGWSQSGIRTTEWRHGAVPFASFPSQLFAVHRSHGEKPLADAFAVLWLDACISLHV